MPSIIKTDSVRLNPLVRALDDAQVQHSEVESGVEQFAQWRTGWRSRDAVARLQVSDVSRRIQSLRQLLARPTAVAS